MVYRETANLSVVLRIHVQFYLEQHGSSGRFCLLRLFQVGRLSAANRKRFCRRGLERPKLLWGCDGGLYWGNQQIPQRLCCSLGLSRRGTETAYGDQLRVWRPAAGRHLDDDGGCPPGY